MKSKVLGVLVTIVMTAFSVITVHAQVKKKTTNANHTKKLITVTGKVAFLNPQQALDRLGYNFNKVYIGKGMGRKFMFYDSSVIKPDGSYSFKINATRPAMHRLSFAKWDIVDFWPDGNAVINVRGYDTAKYKIKNFPYIHIQSKSINNKIINILNNEAYWGYQRMIAKNQEQFLANKNKEKDSAWISYLKNEDIKQLEKPDLNPKLRDVLLKDFAEEPAIIAAVQQINWVKESDKAIAVLNNLIKKYPWHTDAIDLKENIESYVIRSKMLQIGQPAPKFTYNNPNREPVSLESFKGKVVLLDFWASWCGPCKQSIPKLKQQYAKYKDKGFEILSVSIDEKTEAWHKALEEEKMPWTQVISPDMDKTMEEYMFNGIPTLYLVDKEGKILDKFTGYREELEDKLKQLFPN